jgi:hypothetical protein
VTRIVFVELEELFADALEDCLDREPGLQVVGRLRDRGLLLTPRGKALNAGAMVCMLEPQDFVRLCDQVLRAHPGLLALSIVPSQPAILQCRLETRLVTHGNASLADLARIIRGPVSPTE